jgi:hypothetical protein
MLIVDGLVMGLDYQFTRKMRAIHLVNYDGALSLFLKVIKDKQGKNLLLHEAMGDAIDLGMRVAPFRMIEKERKCVA